MGSYRDVVQVDVGNRVMTPDRAGQLAPRVTIGLPVYNGENFVAAAIEAVLTQTISDWELVIADNASVDSTESICRAYAARDRRIVYIRNPRNLGAAPNYNLTLERARGRYFKWLAHDDLMAPDCLEKACDALDARPGASVCATFIRFVGPDGGDVATYECLLPGADSDDPAERFAALTLRSHPCTAVFGLFATDELRNSLQHATMHGADRALLSQMSLRGPFVQLPETLVWVREHPGRYTRRVASAEERALWHDTSRKNGHALPSLWLYRRYVAMTWNELLPTGTRLRCLGTLVRWWFVNWNAARVAVDVLSLGAPGMVGWAERLKTRLFGAAPGHYGRSAG